MSSVRNQQPPRHARCLLCGGISNEQKENPSKQEIYHNYSPVLRVADQRVLEEYPEPPAEKNSFYRFVYIFFEPSVSSLIIPQTPPRDMKCYCHMGRYPAHEVAHQTPRRTRLETIDEEKDSLH